MRDDMNEIVQGNGRGLRRVLSLWLPYLAVEWPVAERRRRGVWDKEAQTVSEVVTQELRGQWAIAGVGARAVAAGLSVGLSMGDARALVPGLRAWPRELAPEQRFLERLITWCGRYTPLVGLDPCGGHKGDAGLFLDITGCDHLFGGEAALLADLLHRLRGWGLTPRGAIADTPGSAWAAARFSQDTVHRRTGTVVPAGGQRAVLAGLPMAALRLPPAATEGLERVGLRRVGALYAMPRAPLTSRFGRAVADRLDQALGVRGEPIEPRAPVVPDRVAVPLAEPVIDLEGMRLVCRRLLGRLCRHLETGQAGARRLRFVIYRVDGETRCLEVGVGRPRRDPEGLYRLFAERLQALDPGLGVDAASLEATVVERTGWRPERLLATGAGQAEGAVVDLADRLANRLGPENVTRLVPHESHLPERAEQVVPALSVKQEEAWPAGAPGPAAARPIRLLDFPERVEALAMLPDHPPARFRWRGVEYRAVRAAGPERIAPEWWRRAAPPTTRDYFRVEDQEGRRYWLYREGLAERGEAPGWFLHGLFA